MLDRDTIMLEGSTAVVTGAGAGIGRAVAESLAAHGASVAVVDSVPQRSAEVARAIEERGGRALDAPADVREREDVDRLRERVLAELGAPDILVNNVGHYLSAGRFVDSRPEDWDALYRVNLDHVLTCTHALLPAMIDADRGGSIVNVTTIEAFRGIPGCAVYSAFKSAITGFTRSLALELGPEGIRVNAVAPETTETEQVQPSRWIPAEHRDREPYWIPAGRFGRPDDIAGSVLFLASKLSAWVTGTTVHVDGGALAAGGFYRVPGGGWTNTPIVTGSGIPG